MAGQNSYDMILDAAEVVVAEDGAPRLTLDAVARRAGLSKGGLLYNFATKDALLEAMIARLCRRFEEARGLAEAHMGATKLKAYLSVTMLKGPGQDRVASALLAAVANNLELLKPMRDHYRSWLQQLSGRPTFAQTCRYGWRRRAYGSWNYCAFLPWTRSNGGPWRTTSARRRPKTRAGESTADVSKIAHLLRANLRRDQHSTQKGKRRCFS